jgi:Ca2+-binding EF-hand superfamily protein
MEMAAKALAEMDEDDDGSISFKESTAAYSPLEKKMLFPILAVVWIASKCAVLLCKAKQTNNMGRTAAVAPRSQEQIDAYRREQSARASWEFDGSTEIVPVASEASAGLSTGEKHPPAYSAEAAFSELDVDGSGTLSKSEVRIAFEHFARGQPIDEDDFNARFAKMDKDGTGQITLDNFKKGAFYQRIAFKLLDVDASGSLEKEEARQVWESIQGVAIDDTEFEKAYAKMDRNDDGLISYKEFRRWLKKTNKVTVRAWSE